jgi:xylulokinase
MPITPTFSFEKIIWVKRNDKEKYNKAKRIVMMPDYVMYRFGADDFYCEMTNACCSGMIDVKTMQWSTKIIDTFGIDRSLLPPLVKPGTGIGRVSAEFAKLTGLKEARCSVPVRAISSAPRWARALWKTAAHP